MALGWAQMNGIQLLSATLVDSPLKMWCVGQMLKVHDGLNFISWCCHVGCFRHPRFNNIVMGETKRAKRLWAETWGEIRARGLIGRVSLADLGDRVKENMLTTEWVEGGEDLDEAYADLLQKFSVLAWAEGGVDPTLPARCATLVEAEKRKLEYIRTRAKQFVAEGCNVYISLNYRENIAELQQGLQDCVVIHGGVGTTDRRGRINEFQSNEKHILIGTPQVAGVGINLHDVNGRQRISLISPNFSTQLMVQTMGRIHRVNSMTPAIQKIVYLADSRIERNMESAIKRKFEMLEAVNR